jgi:hypothetical protein
MCPISRHLDEYLRKWEANCDPKDPIECNVPMKFIESDKDYIDYMVKTISIMKIGLKKIKIINLKINTAFIFSNVQNVYTLEET